MSHVADIIRHYRDKGLVGAELRAAMVRHIRLLSAMDREVASNLELANPCSTPETLAREQRWAQMNRIGTRKYLRKRRQDAEFRASEAARHRAYRASRKAMVQPAPK